MGRPKQILTSGGRTLAEIAVAAVEGFARRVVLAGPGPLPANLESLDRVMDPPGIDGPIAGVLAVMRWAPKSAWIITACDMPRIRIEAVQWLLSQRRDGIWAVLPQTTVGRVEPLFAVYEPEMKEVLERRVQQGRFGFQHLTESDRIHCPIPPDDIRDAWINVNTMEEFRSSSVLDV